MGRQRASDSAMLQLVLTREKDSVAAAKREISVVLGGEGEREGVEVGVGCAVEEVGSESGSVGGGVDGGVGYEPSCGSESGFDRSKTDMRFSRPRILGMR